MVLCPQGLGFPSTDLLATAFVKDDQYGSCNFRRKRAPDLNSGIEPFYILLLCDLPRSSLPF